MSANNQILVADFKGRWYVWGNINAEAWDEKNEPRISIRSAISSFDTEGEAMKYAFKIYANLEWPDECEYGVRVNEFAKDGTKPIIIN